MKYLNNGIESNHSSTKNLIEATGGFKMQKQAWSAIQDFVGIRMLNKGQFDCWLCRDEPKSRVQERSAFVNEFFYIFGIYA
ncbi:transposase [Vibrio sp. HI00D65]|nr:transposase [Vibrio sp. HI00D65]